MRMDVGLLWSDGKGQEVQVIIGPKTLFLPGFSMLDMVIKSLSVQPVRMRSCWPKI